MIWTIAALAVGAIFGMWTHRTSGSGGWSDAFISHADLTHSDESCERKD